MGTRNLPPKAWLLGDNETIGTAEEEVPTEAAEEGEDQPSLTAFKGELNTVVSHYLNQVRTLGYKEGSIKEEDHFLDIKFHLNDENDETTLVVSEPGALDNPLYLSLSECSTGRLESDTVHEEPLYENGNVTEDGEHIYENVEFIEGEPLYDTLPRKPRIPPKPEYLRKQVNKQLDPFVSLAVDIEQGFISADSPSPQDSDLSSNDTYITSDIKDQINKRETREQTIVLDGSETSDLGSSGAEDSGSLEDWPLPPTPPLVSTFHPSDPLPPPPPEIALQQLEEEVIKEEEEEKRLAIQKEKEEIEREYGQAEAVNAGICELVDPPKFPKRKPKICTIDSAEEEQEEISAIRHSVIIQLKETNNQCFMNAEINNNTQDEDCSLNIKVKPAKEIVCNKEKDSLIEISEDGSWETKNSLDNNKLKKAKMASPDTDPFTGQPIMIPLQSDELFSSLCEIQLTKNNDSKADVSESNVIAAPPSEFLSSDGMDGVFKASCISTHSGPSSLASTATESIGEATMETPSLLNESIEEEPQQESFVQKPSSTRVASPVAEFSHTRNLGAAIMERYEKDIQKKKDSLNLPEVSLLEFGDSVRDLEEQRKSVIKQMTVKAKKKDSWIRTYQMHCDSDSNIPTAPLRKKKLSATYEDDDNAGLKSKDLHHASSPQNVSLIVLQKNKINELHSNAETGTLNKIKIATTSVSLNEVKQQVFVARNSSKSDGLNPSNILSESPKGAVFGGLNSPICPHPLAAMINIQGNATSVGSRQETPECVNEKEEEKEAEDFKDDGEVDYFSILEHKEETKHFWEQKMLSDTEEGGWETVANIEFQAVRTEANQRSEKHDPEEFPEFIPDPPPEFGAISPISSDGNVPSLSPENVNEESDAPVKNEVKLPKQYVYGEDVEHIALVAEKQVQVAPKPKIITMPVPPESQMATLQENLIEAEIHEQQLKEEELREQNRDKGASSPASHESDEGFVERISDDRFTHSVQGKDGEQIIYDAVSPPPGYFDDRESMVSPVVSTEAKIAHEIREMRQREEELKTLRQKMSASTENLLEDDVSISRELHEDHFTSITTTTDEGNYSECGDAASSEDKNSDGSESRVMSPEVPTPSHEYRSRQITVRPYQEEPDEEELPVYTRMKKESVIEREIRLAKEREEAYQKEKGLQSAGISASPVKHTPSTNTVYVSKTSSTDTRDVQHRLATFRIQQEIEETSFREKELMSAGKILTLSEDTVDSKVTRMSDLALQEVASPNVKLSRVFSSPTPPIHTPIERQNSPNILSPVTPYSPPNFTPSPVSNPKLIRSLSTNNLSSSQAIRVPKGLMQKFIESRGKISSPAFLSLTPTLKGVPTRPMRVEPKASVIQREQEAKQQRERQKVYKRFVCSAEEKIQEELKEMQKREEELRRIRQIGRSHPSLSSEFMMDEEPRINGVISHDKEPEGENPKIEVSTSHIERSARRKNALIAQWENRIQQTAET